MYTRIGKGVVADTHSLAAKSSYFVGREEGSSLKRNGCCALGLGELGMNSREIANYRYISLASVSAWISKGEVVCGANGISLVLIYC